MNFNRFFVGASYSLLAVSFAMLAATRRLDAPSFFMFVGVLTAGCFIDLERLRWNLSRRLANALIIIWLGVALIEWQLFHASPVSVITHFVLFAASLKLLRPKTNRDWLWLHIVSFCIVLMSAGMMMGTTFMFLLIVYLLAAASTFIAFEIRRSQQAFEKEVGNREVRNQEPGNQETGSRKVAIELWREVNDQRRTLQEPGGRSLFFFSALAMVVILLLAAPLFFIVPRVTNGAGRGGLLQGEALSGFSDTVRLGEVAQVKLNPQIVMRVRVSFPSGQQNQSQQQSLRWRGVTLDHYDGQSWNNSGPDPLPIRRYGEAFRLDEHDYRRGVTEQQFFMEPLELRNVFAAPRPVLVSGVPDLLRDLGDGLWTEAYRLNKLNYSVYSDTSIPNDEALTDDNSREYPRNITQRYLQLPENHDRRIDQLAAQLTENAKTQFETARCIEHYLRTQFDYTLDLQRVEDGDPVADFLFNTRAGHCEYFASAMVLMLRARRIPARLVNGFQTGEYNPTADVFTVRQSDAHSWVEAYFPRSKWVAFDPTPAAGLSAYDGGLMSILRQYSEAMEMLWLEQVVAFDTSKQISMLMAAQNWMSSYQKNISWQWMEWTRGFAEKFDSWRGNPTPAVSRPEGQLNSFNWRDAASHPLTLVLFGIAVAGLVLLQRKRFRRNAGNINASESAIRFYREMLSALERAGHRRQPDQTPLEFASQIGMPAVSEITQLYQRQRFSDEILTNEETVRIEMLLRDLKKNSKKK
jgi:transglutaminase-like putative cysteine protease